MFSEGCEIYVPDSGKNVDQKVPKWALRNSISRWQTERRRFAACLALSRIPIERPLLSFIAFCKIVAIITGGEQIGNYHAKFMIGFYGLWGLSGIREASNIVSWKASDKFVWSLITQSGASTERTPPLLWSSLRQLWDRLPGSTR